MQQRGEGPERGKLAGEIAKRCRSTMPLALAIDDVHLLHQLVVRQVAGEGDGGRIVQGDEGQLSAPVPGIQSLDLAGAELAVSVKDDHVGSWTVLRFG